jgi:hypothetical protein
MGWAEVIRVCAAGSNGGLVDATLKELMNSVEIEAEHEAIRVFRHEKLDSDICIFWFHNGKKMGTGGSPLGLRLAAALKEVGLVNHTIWRELFR